ncbi:hypothetical protein Q0F98_37050 [Paenibacillus amylolyticus]|nr:hypothetical protein Q0F98_37050 [Paenibacillus amylolyticus]
MGTCITTLSPKTRLSAKFSEEVRRCYGEHVSQLAEQSGDALNKLLLLSESWLALENNWAYTILIHTARLESSSEEIRREVTERFTNNLGPVMNIMEQGQKEGLIVSGVPLELAYYFVSLIQGLTLQKCLALKF